MAVNEAQQFIPDMMSDFRIKILVDIIQDDKAKKIVELLESKPSYLNKIQEIVGGSKSHTMIVLQKLEDDGTIQSEWKINDNNKAVKYFKLNQKEVPLLQYYSRLIKYS